MDADRFDPAAIAKCRAYYDLAGREWGVLRGTLFYPSLREPAVSALFVGGQERRYAITVWWQRDARLLTWLLLNPSIAGQEQTKDNLDPTLRRVRDFTAAAGCGGFQLLNLYSLVSTDPKGLAAEVEPEDLSWEAPALMGLALADRVVCAWGAHPRAQRRAVAMLANVQAPMACLAENKDGSPCHPLYLGKHLTLKPWAVPAEWSKS